MRNGRSLKGEVIPKPVEAITHLYLTEKKFTTTRTIPGKIANAVLNNLVVRKSFIKEHFQPIGHH